MIFQIYPVLLVYDTYLYYIYNLHHHPILVRQIPAPLRKNNEVQSARSRRLFVHVRTRDQGFNSRCRKLSSMFTLYRGGPRTTTWPGSGWAGQIKGLGIVTALDSPPTSAQTRLSAAAWHCRAAAD